MPFGTTLLLQRNVYRTYYKSALLYDDELHRYVFLTYVGQQKFFHKIHTLKILIRFEFPCGASIHICGQISSCIFDSFAVCLTYADIRDLAECQFVQTVQFQLENRTGNRKINYTTEIK